MKAHLSIVGSCDRERWQPVQQCRLFPVPFFQGGYGSAPQPIVNWKRTLVRWQVQDSDWDWQNRLETQRSQVRIERRKLHQMPGNATSHGSRGPRDKEKAGGSQWTFSPVFYEKRQDLSCNLRWRKPDGELIKGESCVPWFSPVAIAPFAIGVMKLGE
jgi:hypothetical protein